MLEVPEGEVDELMSMSEEEEEEEGDFVDADSGVEDVEVGEGEVVEALPDAGPVMMQEDEGLEKSSGKTKKVSSSLGRFARAIDTEVRGSDRGRISHRSERLARRQNHKDSPRGKGGRMETCMRARLLRGGIAVSQRGYRFHQL